jgi:hypothetical protein
MRQIALALAASACIATLHATSPTADTARWWGHIRALANDGMEGRDTGSRGYQRAAQYVVDALKRAGARPGNGDSYYQPVPLHVVRFRADTSEARLVRGAATRPLAWNRHIRVAASPSLPPTIDAPMVFIGSAGWERDVDVTGKLVVQLAPPPAAPRTRDAMFTRTPPGAVGLVAIDNLDTLEPRRWPVQYSVAMTIRGQAPAAYNGLTIAWNPAAAEWLFEESGHTYRELKALWDEGKPLPNFNLQSSFRATMRVEEADLESPNIVATIPGSDPVLGQEHLVLSAHLDGYGFGEPWQTSPSAKPDRIYNGAFDDAAMVATLIDFAQRLRDASTRFRRSITLAIFTAEEKGLLGSLYFTDHLPVARDRVVANVNLDQVRPLFPLKQLTAIAVDDSTLGDTVRRVAGGMGLRIQADPEPWRNLMRRADNWNFMQIGVPATGFVLAPEKGGSDEAIYKEWYARRYHTPLDDLDQPWDPTAAAAFHEFFGKVVTALANDDERPRWKPGSEYAKPSR